MPREADAERFATDFERLAEDAGRVRRLAHRRVGAAGEMREELVRIATRAGGLLAASKSAQADRQLEGGQVPAQLYWVRMIQRTWGADLHPTFRPRAQADELLKDMEKRLDDPIDAIVTIYSSHRRDDVLDVVFFGEVAEVFEACARAAADWVRRRGQRDHKRPGLPREEANVRARQLLQEDPELTARDLADRIPCALGTVAKLPVWKAVAKERDRVRSTSPGARALPTEIAHAGFPRSESNDDGATLDRLIAEQQADTEPSPLSPDADGRPLRVRAHKRV